MTFMQIIQAVFGITDEDAGNILLEQWVNAGIDELADIVLLDRRVNVPMDSDGLFPLPDDLVEIISVTAAAAPYGNSLPVAEHPPAMSNGYILEEGKLRFFGSTPGAVSLHYYHRPAYVSTADANRELGLPNAYIWALVYFAAAQLMLREDEPERYALFVQEYNRQRELVMKLARNRRKSGTQLAWKVVR